VGTNSGQDGSFRLDISKYPSMPLSISALGYNIVTLTGFSHNKPVSVYMTPKVFELKDVVVSDQSLVKVRKGYMKLFRSTFLGTTPNGSLSTISNEDDIHFIYDKSDTIKAYAVEPLKIENKGLGYTITFFLDEFEYDRRNDGFFFVGNIFFNEDLNTDESLKQRYEWRRKSAFKGSKMHFLRALWSNELSLNGFWIEDIRGKPIKYEDMITEDEDGNKYLWYQEKLIIYYLKSEPSGFIIFKKDKVYFEKSGFFDAMNLIWGGEIAKKRIADWLPYEYTIPDK
jgi:hypothetical protein